MIIADAIARLEAETGTTFRKIEGALALAGLTGAPKQTPCAFVVPIAEDAGSNHLVGAVSQENVERFGIVVALKSVNDPTGEKATTDLETVRDAARDAILGWTPDEAYTPCEFSRGRLLSLRDSTVWWQDEFTTKTHLRKT